ncbi:MAG: hypothetical protein GX308_05610 [Epulopiscium sp.]|nr:hypothetical protein [Candidatus Epulonipiscium sp.]
MYRRLFISFLFMLCLFKSCIVYGKESKVILLISSEGYWTTLEDSFLVSALLPNSSIGSMNTRINHKDKIIESYATINVGRRWSYYEVNKLGAVERGLGVILNQSGFSTALFSDKDELKKIIENSQGKTTYTSTDYTELYSKQNKSILEKSDVVLIDMDLYNNKENEEYLLGFINENIVKLYLFCPYDKESKSELTPFLYYDSLNPQSGFISAATTRREGIITNLDIAPAILSHFDIVNSSMVSSGIKIIHNENPYPLMIKRLNKIYYINSYRSKMIKTYNTVLIMGLIVFYIGDKLKLIKMKKLYHGIMLAILWIPILFMMNFYKGFLQIYFIVFLAIVILGLYNTRYEKALGFISGSILAIIVIDTLSGCPLQQNSFLGYDPIIGARFYGIGNEYAGILIGNLYLFIYSIRHYRHHKTMTFLLQIGVVLILGMPFLGANVGGTIAAIGGMVLFYISNHRRNKKVYLVFMIGALGFLVVWGMMDSFFMKEQSHLGQTLFQFAGGNFNVFSEIIGRKMMMNLQLIRYSLWSKNLIISLIILGLYFNPNNQLLKKVGAALIGAMSGGILFNDSGIIMSSTCIIYLVFPYLSIYMDSKAMD